MADWHVLPINDTIEHLELRQCWCRPEIRDAEMAEALVIHNSADGREYFEKESDDDE